MKYFSEVHTQEELKKQYKQLVKTYHPDLNRDRDTTEIMKQINSEYEQLFDMIGNVFTAADGETYTKNTTETAQDYMDIINQLIYMDGIEIELIGVWVWVSGNTRKHKNELKTMGFGYSAKKQAWYWHKDEWHGRRGNNTLNDLRIKYGATKFHGAAESELSTVTA